MAVTSIADDRNNRRVTTSPSPEYSGLATWLVLGLSAAFSACGWVGRELLVVDEDEVDEGPSVEVPIVVPEHDAGELDVAPEVDAGESGAAIEADAGAQDAGPEACDFSGTWAAKVEIRTAWNATTAIASGAGTARVWMRYQLQSDGSLVPGTLALCGVTMPDFRLHALLGDETYGVDFGTALFDNEPSRIFSSDAVMHVDGAGFPGDAFTMTETVQVLGTTLDNPLADAWPSAGSLVDNDMDQDGKPGVTLVNLDDATHVLMRVDALGTVRSDKGYYASRVSMSWNGTVLSCDEIAGDALVPRFDTHIVGCSLVAGGECSALQRSTLDSLRPIHRPQSAGFQGIRVEAGASCASVRNAL